MSREATSDRAALGWALELAEKTIRERDETIRRLRADLDGTFTANGDMYRRMVEANVEAERLRFELWRATR